MIRRIFAYVMATTNTPISINLLIVLSSVRFSLANDGQCSEYVLTTTGLDCNTGICRVGVKNYENLFPMVNVDQLRGEQCFHEQACAYCDCNEDEVDPGRAGTTGIECDTKFVRCPDGKQVCFHGAPCVEVGEMNGYVCGCSYIQDGYNANLGEHCEYLATSTCYGRSTFGSYQPFCTNNGECRFGTDGEDEEKCDCKEGFYGVHCEFKKDPNCDLECKNGGFCNTGADSFYREQTSKSYCVCPEGYSGDTCQYTDAEDCRGSVCMNGSTCRSEYVNGNTNYFCDCSNVDKVDEAGNKIPHAGKDCETPATTMCTGQDGYTDEEYFCTNGGTCPTDPHLPCTCPQPFSGSHCEFKGEETKECSYQCENGGVCFFGDTPDYHGVDRTPIGETEMHCKCPPEYTGLHCENDRIILCDDKHHCENGGKCVQDGDEFTCDCTGTFHAGSHCELPATTLCGALGYCVNGGSCEQSDNLVFKSHCVCDPPFYGNYCEYEDLGSSANKVFLGFTISTLGLFAGFVTVKYFENRKVEYEHQTLDGGPKICLDGKDADNQAYDKENNIT